MALINRRARPGLDASTGMYALHLAGNLVAGEAIAAGAACYIAADGRVFQSNGTAANAAAKCLGFAPMDYLAGETVSLYGVGARFGYGTGLVPGTALFVAATAGRLDNVATIGGTVPVAVVVNTTGIMIIAATA